jgi:hypothetical protein
MNGPGVSIFVSQQVPVGDLSQKVDFFFTFVLLLFTVISYYSYTQPLFIRPFVAFDFGLFAIQFELWLFDLFFYFRLSVFRRSVILPLVNRRSFSRPSVAQS